MPLPYLKPKKGKTARRGAGKILSRKKVSHRIAASPSWEPHHHAASVKRAVGNGRMRAWVRLVQKKKHLMLKIALTGSVLIGSAVVVTGFILFRDLPDPQSITERKIAESTKIFDRTGKQLLYDVHGEVKRTQIALTEIPEHVRWATLVAEDRDFYRHGGIKLTSIIRAALVNAIRGERAQGASTITQQLIKNAFLTTEKIYSRKLREIVLAWQLERKFSKDEILEMYFNEIPYGSVAYGIEAAAEIYFGKSARDLTIAEGAVLSGIAKAPSYYSPHGTHKDQLIERQHFIINQMAREGYITNEEARIAEEQPLEFRPLQGTIIAPHFVMFIREQLAESYGESAVEQGGLTVITSLDISKQEKAEKAIAEWGPINERDYQAQNAALAALDPKTGEILAMVGSRDFFDDENDGQVNVTLRPRQPGSSFKPIVYAAGFSQGLSPDTVLFDVITKFITDTGKTYEPHNYTGKEYGPVTLRTALAGSLNIPAVKTIYLTGINHVLNLAEKLGYSTFSDRSRFGLSLVLGGGEVLLLDHVAAFGAFARDGIYHAPVSILKVTDSSGSVLMEAKLGKGKEALDSFAVRQINSILSDNSARAYIFGEKNYLTLSDRPVAAKTGTTNDFRDAWTVGYTPSLVAGVWVGNNDFSAMKKGADGSAMAAPIWNMFMKSVLTGTPVESFKTPPPSPLPEKPMLNGKIGEETIIRIDRASRKLATPLTPASFIEEKIYQTVHTILHYVSPGDILGPAPLDPQRDTNYHTWEEAVQRWAKEQNIEQATPPVEYDDLHTEQNRPTITLLKPLPQTNVYEPYIEAEVIASAPRGISRIAFSINNVHIAELKNEPYTLHYTIGALPNGTHMLTATAYDDIDNSQSVSIPFNLTLAQELTPFTSEFTTPEDGASVNKTAFPIPLALRVGKPERIKKVDFYFRPKNSTLSEWIGYKEKMENGLFSIIWETPPPQGEYTFYAVLSDTESKTTIPTREYVITISE